MCKERKVIRAQLKEREERARLAGQVYYDPRTLTTWYRMYDSAVEFAVGLSINLMGLSSEAC